MGAEFNQEVKQGILFIRIKGEPMPDEIMQILKKTRNESGYTHELRLWDFQHSIFPLKHEDLENVAAQASIADAATGKVAMVVREDLSFGVARMYAAYRNTPFTEVEVFREESEAIAWLLSKAA